MHPEPAIASENAPLHDPSQKTLPSSSQHGHTSFPQRPSPSRDGTESGLYPGLTGGTVQSSPYPPARASPVSEAEPVNTLSPPPRNRIAEYENALNPKPKKRGGVLFEVIPKENGAKENSSPISALPNEVLTHALSHLSPNDLAAVALVSRRFNSLVTSPHAWMVAFARYFPGPEALLDDAVREAIEEVGDIIRSGRRAFTRLTALASWRSEYILRTRLLRSLVRGRPVQVPATPSSPRPTSLQLGAPIVMYPVRTFTLVNHLHATFGTGLNKRVPRLIHGADDVGMATSSDPTTGKVDAWGESDPTFFVQFSERFPGEAEWGLGPGDVVGRPNVMDVSQPYGIIYGEGSPQGSCYYRAVDEMRGHFIAETMDFSNPAVGIPKLGVDGGAVCSVWIAKSKTIPTLTDGLVGMMMGSAAGVVTACSLGTDGLRGQRLQRGELTARWVLSPGVPIIAIAVDDQYSVKRQAQNRIWAVALNALGEIFYLTKFPSRNQVSRDGLDAAEHAEYTAWVTGRTVHWNLVELSRRVARPDPYNGKSADGSYSPRSSWDDMCLSELQISAETKEIQQFLRYPPKHFRKACLGWDMRRRLEVDFAGDDGHYAGEAIIVFECGLGEGNGSSIKRFTRCKTHEKEKDDVSSPSPLLPPPASLFGNSSDSRTISDGPNSRFLEDIQRTRSSSHLSSSSSPERMKSIEEWRCSQLSLGGLSNVQLTATALDHSTYAVLTMSEDPALGFSTASTASSPYASPVSVASQPASPADIPGQRARFLAAGTATGAVLVWDIRSPVSRSSGFTNTIDPVRIIYTDSPEISCIGLTSLYLVHGGNDGLVQAWDVLASTTQPIKTLNPRFSSRARRRLVQAQASAQGVGINMFAAGAICLDPDPTTLRGAVSLGNQIRYWSYSSTAADQYKSNKRKLRRSERGSNNGGERFSGTGRGKWKDHIANEKYELERDQRERDRQAARLAGRFGVDLLGSEEEALAYAALLSQESLAEEEKKRKDSGANSVWSSSSANPAPSIPGNEDIDADIAEAIRLSLQDNPTYDGPSSSFDIPIIPVKGHRSPVVKGKRSARAESSKHDELSDLEFALQLSLAEEQSRKEAVGDDGFPVLIPNMSHSGNGKGKGRA
ncbi:uncharacterized protein EI97DRAFT_405191 [Westerdykella ornata]|uniref:F-box domain-containing protein n=1 Tax=Westerdykella ornata TaxID=318751 RepID=A0A6A6J9N8_WESOR|nr:uncharacterized protein EI97DRAFT_405191 [Westerdykella ornata]KAF2273045.1 hypothetical protein EI97DRAFT_405191 [Westerdykella ornata]